VNALLLSTYTMPMQHQVNCEETQNVAKSMIGLFRNVELNY